MFQIRDNIRDPETTRFFTNLYCKYAGQPEKPHRKHV